jgi:high affinity sulfate transporter 1
MAVNPFVRKPPPRGLQRWIPAIAVVKSYRCDWLARDAVAGLVLTAILVPVGMGYAEVAGLPAIYGLYATIFPMIAYAIFGPSRILVLGPDSALAAMIAATVLPVAAANSGRAVALAGMLAILSGAMCVLAGVARFGFIADLFSKPIRYGYLNGIALTILMSQIPKILGLPGDGEDLVQRTYHLVRSVLSGNVNWTALGVGAGCLILILFFKQRLPKIPGALVAVIGASLAVAFFDLRAKAGIAVVGFLPGGLPAFRIPAVSAEDLIAISAGAGAIALVSLADMSVLSRTFALRGGYKVDTNQELVAMGAANIAAGLFQGFSVTCSATRTPVAESAGAKSQVTSLVGAACIALLLMFAPTLLRNLPHAALGAVVIAACLSLVEITGVLRFYRLRRVEFWLSLSCFLGVALVGVIKGIFIAVGLALLNFIWRAWRPHDAVLGRVDGLKGYHDIRRHPEGRRIPGLVLFRWDAPLFFANAEIFHEHVLQAVADAPEPVRWVVVAAEPVTDIDITAADALAQLDADLQEAGIELCFAEMKGPVKDHLKRYDLFTQLGKDNFFPTIGQAVDRYLEVHQIAWKDWDEA